MDLGASANAGVGAGGTPPPPTASGLSGFMNFANFANPQSYIDPLLQDSNVEVREHQFTGGNTLDESVLTTLHRDLVSITDKLLSILWPMRLRQKLQVLERVSGLGSRTSGDIEEEGDIDSSRDYSKETIRKILDWDLWGPLVINLGFSLVITHLQTRTLDSSEDRSSSIFSAAFTLIWASLAVLSLNIQLVWPVKQQTESGGTTSGVIGLSFFQCISILSYTLFPVMLGGVICIFIHLKFIRIIINTVMLSWSLLCSWLILAIISNCRIPGATSELIYNSMTERDQGTAGDKRIFLMIYPILLVYGLFSWLCVIL
ncbi:hypothetical protein FOA43_001143 [Brettanomyces nanus]|uniref:Protein YIP n=1 Tax=Eeniella nana TaxID=13502 RepID=A0A875RYN8_EENNA|nr:uncharacterized protein FOA43_001143 [Brettanomyces nanus]QPG73828.1 hypothetical protein FOA43_001143 [Brettanomyces nanus]